MTWVQAKAACLCGSCNEPITEQAPMLLVTSAALKRCVACAKARFNAEPPTSWPEVKPLVVPKLPEFATARALAKDFDPKLAQLAAGDR